jgi:transposase
VPADEDRITELVTATGIDRNVIERYVEADRKPPHREDWLMNGVPTKDRSIVFTPTKRQSGEAVEESDVVEQKLDEKGIM